MRGSGSARPTRSAAASRDVRRPAAQSDGQNWWEPGGSTPSAEHGTSARGNRSERTSRDERRPASGASRPSREDSRGGSRPTRDDSRPPWNGPREGSRPASRAERPERQSDRPARWDSRPAQDAGRPRYDRGQPSTGGYPRSERPGDRTRSAPGTDPSRHERSPRTGYQGRQRREEEDYESTRGSRPTRGAEIAIPPEADPKLLDPSVRSELRSLSKLAAEFVGAHLVAAGQAIDNDPKKALEHARAARGRGARVGAVREATGLAAYHAGEWAEALSELRAARRISGSASNIAVMADCERALGRPERALKSLDDPVVGKLDPATRAELLIVVAGARRDMGQLDAALAVLERGGLDTNNARPGSARLWYAYADALEAAGRVQDAIQWFGAAAKVDFEDETDAADRAASLL